MFRHKKGPPDFRCREFFFFDILSPGSYADPKFFPELLKTVYFAHLILFPEPFGPPVCVERKEMPYSRGI